MAFQKELEQMLVNLESTLAGYGSSHYAEAVISSLRQKIEDNLKAVNDEGFQDGWDAKWQEEQQGRRVA